MDVAQLPDVNDFPRVRYLSQQFVDQLCSSDGLADELGLAMEQVVFDAHDVGDRYGARSFNELRSLRTEAVQESKEGYSEALREIGKEISNQDDLERSLGDLEKKLDNETAQLERMKADRNKLTPSDNKDLVARLEAVRSAAESKSQSISSLEKKKLHIEALKQAAIQFETSGASIQLQNLKQHYSEAGLSEDQWANFTLKYKGDVKTILTTEISNKKEAINKLKGPADGEVEEQEGKAKSPVYIPQATNLSAQTLSLLKKEQRRLEAIIGLGNDKKQKYLELSRKINKAETALTERKKEIENAKAAPQKKEELFKRRVSTYEQLVTQIEEEEKVLAEIYKPLKERLQNEEGTLSKLTFSINRIVDLDAWALAGENLIDKSRSGEFRGGDSLKTKIKEELEQVWKAGNAKQIAKAMSEFRKKYGQAFWSHAPENVRKSRESQKRFYDQISSWLYSIDHIDVTY